MIVASAYAAGTTDQAVAQAPATNGQSATVRIRKGGEIPKELADKLTGDQIAKILTPGQKEEIPPLALVIIAIPFLFAVACVTVVCLFQLRRNAMLHRTLAAMIEKGVPIPPELLQPTGPVKPKRSDLHRGLVACGVGIGLMLFLWIVGGGLVDGRQVSGLWGPLAASPLVAAIQVKGIWAVGFIPLFIGIGYVISWKLEQRKPNS
jgi:hypothetical protein